MTVTRRPGVCGSNSFSVCVFFFYIALALKVFGFNCFLCSSVFLHTKPSIPFDDLKYVVFLAYSFYVLASCILEFCLFWL